jgi:hypothetical protein
MSIERFFNKSAAIKRLTVDILDSDKSSYQTSSTISCHIQQLSLEETVVVEGVFGKTFRMYCAEDADIQQTDRVTIDGKDFTIKGIKTFEVEQSTSPVRHKQVVIVDNLS